MKLTVLATGSTGNASIVTGKNETIAIDFGLSFSKWDKLIFKNKLKYPDHVFITHSHGDHMNISGLSRLSKKHTEIEVHTNRGIFETSEFKVICFLIPHNVENHAVIVTEKATGKKLVYVTDCSAMYDTLTASRNLKYTENADIYALEANYDNGWLKHPEYLDQMAYRYDVLGNMTRHTSKQECIKTFSKLKKEDSELVTLHMSSRFFNFS